MDAVGRVEVGRLHKFGYSPRYRLRRLGSCEWLCRGNESRREDRRPFCASPGQNSGPMVPMVVGADQLVSHLLLLR